MFCIYRADKETYRLIHVGKNEEMWHVVYREHQAKFPTCCGMLEWDLSRELKRGLCWEEACKCTVCNYKSKRFKLYEEINTGKRGKKAAAPNLGIHVGLTQTPIAYEGVRKLLLSANTPAPSESGLRKAAHKVCDTIVKENKSDMRTRRQELKQINKLRGMDENSIPVEGDGAYNNPIYSVGNTPFQAATQHTYIIAEGTTEKRQIIALTAKNKLCSVGARKGLKCPGEDHDCTANIPATATIGNEQAWASEGLQSILEDGLQASTITTDPDSGAYRAAEQLYKDGKYKAKPEHFLDTRHLSANMRKNIYKMTFSKNMFTGRLAVDRKKMHNRFVLDLVKRCETEFRKAHEYHTGSMLKLQKCLSKVKKNNHTVLHGQT